MSQITGAASKKVSNLPKYFMENHSEFTSLLPSYDPSDISQVLKPIYSSGIDENKLLQEGL